MAFTWDLIVGIVAGGLILGLGAFVLAAHPRSSLHQLFSALAFTDGLSTILFMLSEGFESEAAILLAQTYYMESLIAFVFLVAAFGFLFPTTFGGHRAKRPIAIGLTVGALLTLAAYRYNYRWFWTATRADEGIVIQYGPVGQIFVAFWMLVIGAVIARMAHAAMTGPSENHRRQAAYVLSGFILGYGPFVAGTVNFGLTANEGFAARLPIAVGYWSAAIALVVTIAAASFVLFRHSPLGRLDRRVVAGATIGVVLVSLVVFVAPYRILNAVQAVGLLAYPLLLGFSIMQYGVLDIDAKFRRAATVAIVAAGLAFAFLIFEELLEAVFQGPLEFLGGTTANLLAALGAATVAYPVITFARRMAGRIAPELDSNDLERRRLDIYHHALTGILADGIIDPRETRILKNLREVLNVTMAEHDRLIGSIQETTF